MAETREEQYLAKISGEDVAIPAPITRKEKYLYNIAKKPGGGGATTWDELEGKPFETIPPMYDITWDGDMTGRTALDLSAFGFDGYYQVKVSDKVYTKEELTGKFIFLSNGVDFAIAENAFVESVPGCFSVYENMLVCVVYSASEMANALDLPDDYVTNGTYFLSIPSAGIYASTLGYPYEVVKKLDKKYLPDTVVVRHNLVGEEPELRCTLKGGWSTYTYDFSPGNPWYIFYNSTSDQAVVNISFFTNTEQTDYMNASIVVNNRLGGGIFEIGYANALNSGAERLFEIKFKLEAGVISVAVKEVTE